MQYKFLFSFLFFIIACKDQDFKLQDTNDIYTINCTEEYCKGYYKGPEFIKRSDVAHQLSNAISAAVGDKLKELYDAEFFSKVDFNGIEMSTEGMGTGEVEFVLLIPFIKVQTKCESFTSFDHVGGWNHKPELRNRKKQLNRLLLTGEELNISDLKKTKEGLQEYWIQWKNREKQISCLK